MTSLQEAFTKARIQWDKLQDSKVPIFFVGAATCGRAAGASEMLERLRGYIKAKSVDALVIEVGCLGLCYLEPLVIVHKPGAPRVCYGNVGPDEIIAILENHVLGNDPCAQWALGKVTAGELEGIGDFNEHPMLRRQVRRILRNCGLIDPENSYHYLARDGYRGFLKALEIGPGKILEGVKASGLRGRGGAGFP
ncbi:MAG: NADH-quinone oxidoreductase subunit F, partial [Desulfobacteraceae bacterium]|nr:NADH-quinone oxidoreductase subunit F [Desulfobacteraceae bacterium]